VQVLLGPAVVAHATAHCMGDACISATSMVSQPRALQQPVHTRNTAIGRYSQGIPVWYTLVGLAAPAQLLLAVEANRHGSSGLLAWYTFFAVVLQVRTRAWMHQQSGTKGGRSQQ